MKTALNILLITGLLSIQCSDTLAGNNEKVLPLEKVSMDNTVIDARYGKWIFHKVCLAGQAYWISRVMISIGNSDSIGMSPSFKDGKPEQCTVEK